MVIQLGAHFANQLERLQSVHAETIRAKIPPRRNLLKSSREKIFGRSRFALHFDFDTYFPLLEEALPESRVARELGCVL